MSSFSFMLGKLDVFRLDRVSLGRGSQEMLPLSPRIMPRAAAPRAPLYEENEEEESVLERGGRTLCLASLPSGMCESQLGALGATRGAPSTGAR